MPEILRNIFAGSGASRSVDEGCSTPRDIIQRSNGRNGNRSPSLLSLCCVQILEYRFSVSAEGNVRVGVREFDQVQCYEVKSYLLVLIHQSSLLSKPGVGNLRLFSLLLRVDLEKVTFKKVMACILFVLVIF